MNFRMKRVYAFAVAGAAVVGVMAGAQLTQGATAETQAAFVAITPCRLIDTRPASKIGTLKTFTSDKTQTAQVRGTNGECNIPPEATGIALNVTAVGGTQNSFLALWPAGATRPKTSNLNWNAGQAPTPNKVDIGLSSGGAMSLYNRFGQVDVIADVVGYYSPVATAKGTISAVQIRTAQITLQKNASGAGSNGNATATCPAGMVAIAGGVENPVGYALNTRSTRPNPVGNNPTGWFGDVRSGTDLTGVTATVYAVCITLNL